MAYYNATECGDGVFGPGVWGKGCRGGFDFTLAFEESILTILPAAVFLLLSAPRSAHLLRTKDKARKEATYTPKLLTAVVYAALQIAVLALVASSKHLNSKFSIASAVLSLLASSSIVLLAHAEHVKSIRPSFLITAYLFASLLFDAARLRTEWLLAAGSNAAYASVLSTSVAVKLSLLVLETVEKRSILIDTSSEPSEESTSGPFSRGLFVWLNPLLITGWATALTNKDLPAIHERLSSKKLEASFVDKWDRATSRTKKPMLFLTTVNLLKWDLLSIVLPRVAMIGLSISQPYLVSDALRFLSMASSDATTNLGYGLIGAFACVFIGSAILTAWHEHLTFRAGAMIRGGLISLIYRKLVKLPTKQLGESSAVSLMGNDVEMLTERINMLLVESWANTVTVAISMWMLTEQLGAVSAAPIITSLISLALNAALGSLMVPRQMTYQNATQDRINFTSEVLGSMKAVKMLGYTENFTKLIEKKRDNDINSGKQFRVLTVWANVISNGNICITQTVTFGAYAIAAKLSGTQSFSAAQAIKAVSILNVMMAPLSQLLSSIPLSFSAFGCFKRIENFLLLDERIDSRDIQSGPRNTILERSSGASSTESIKLQTLAPRSNNTSSVAIVDGDFNWGEKPILRNINTYLPRSQTGSLTMIIGPIGSGKSTFLKAILGETTSSNGVISINSSTVAFCDQTPWIMNATIRHNIIAETEGFNESWFNAVVEACDLSIDLEALPSGSSTVVGDKGLKLSGGQKQRIVSPGHCFILPSALLTTVKAMARAIYSRKPVAIFDDVFSGLDKVTERTVFSRVFSENGILRRSGTTIVLTTHAVHHLPDSDFVIALGKDGSIVEQGTFSTLRTTGGYVQALDISLPHSDVQTEEHTSKAREQDYTREKQVEPENIEQQRGRSSDRTTFKYYLASMTWLNIAQEALYIILHSFFYIFRFVWLTWWGEGKGRSSTDIGYWLGLYAAFSVIDIAGVSLGIMQALIIMGPTSGKTLHTRVLNAVMSAPLSFLLKNETGSLVNRFSQDMRLVDIVLPMSLSVFLFEAAACFGVAGLAVSAVSWFAISIPFVIAALAVIQRFYIRTSKQLRLLEIEHKAPLYSHFLESINGLATIRAFGWIQPYTEKSMKLLDNAQKPSYLLYCIQRWLTLVLDLVLAGMTILLVTLAVILREKIDPSLLGIALVNMMGHRAALVDPRNLARRRDADKELSENTPSENLPKENRVLDASWPACGALEVQNVSVQYDSKDEPILRNVTFSIRHGEKIGLCGRSGSGKSSMIQALLRLANVVEGRIFLDGEDITRVPRSLLRQKLSCLTQDPFLFTNTIRFNMDPLGEHLDEEVNAALERVGLWSTIRAKLGEDKQPLDEEMDETFFSHGQRQLLCLARALLKQTFVLILDEPTSSVDSQTDAKIQEVIRTEFKGRTIIMIAHRLDTLLDFDKVAVLDKGSLVEFESPGALLKNQQSHFARLYRADKSKRQGGE
ncbi:ABC transporter C family member 12 [Tolypocladium paradoxum]|uniref:ABC transporter C family member 12 n=1 Tax=Tolypocladium paradoxum TaxID=94208 RepID=A0A2S4KLT8_9HYPO|nr:ABC transporter C family member 12 [Tolypocladium paradoxum]